MKINFYNLSMVKSAAPVALLIAITVWAQLVCPRAGASPNGEQVFKENCASCHTGGGNLVEPKKPVKGSTKLASVDKFKEYLLKPSGAMQPAPKIANDAPTLDALYKYCKTLK
jgi:mono/diheme cytochrome c family protein